MLSPTSKHLPVYQQALFLADAQVEFGLTEYTNEHLREIEVSSHEITQAQPEPSNGSHFTHH